MLDEPVILPEDPEELRSFTARLLAEVKAQAILIEKLRHLSSDIRNWSGDDTKNWPLLSEEVLMEAVERKPHCDREGDRGEVMKEPDEVAAMLRLKKLGWGVRRIAGELGCSHMTVRRYVASGGWVPARAPERPSVLDGLEGWLAERLRRHRGNAHVVRQDLAREHGIAVSLRTIQRACAPHRRALAAEARATVRFETPPGHQLQVDFGEVRTPVAGESGRVFLFVATLGYSRPFVRAFRHERQSAWLDGIEGAFRHFGGVTTEVLVDNARALVSRHDAATREVAFNGRFLAFARYWGFRPRACAPYRARTKGKDERGVGYVKRNAIAGHRFASWAALEAHLACWTREVADVRVHGTTGEAPIARFERDEAAALKPVSGRAPFRQLRELLRVVQSDACIELDTNRYSVPWRLIGATVTVLAGEESIVLSHAGADVARHEVPAVAASGLSVPSISTVSWGPGAGPRRRRAPRRRSCCDPLPNTSACWEEPGDGGRHPA